MRARVIVLVVAFAAGARAEDDPTESARKHFAEGVQRFQGGDFEGARAAFQRAESEHHAPAIVYNIARAEERLFHPQAAVDAYERYLAEAGDASELGAAAALAIAQIRARSPRVRIETTPPGARVFLDGAPLAEPAPTTTLVTAGRHHVVVSRGEWREERDVEALDPARIETVHFDSPEVAPARPASPEDLVLGGTFVVVPYYFAGAKGRPATTLGIAAGGMLDVGYALTDSAEIFVRGIGALGQEGSPYTSLWAAGVAFSVRIRPNVWLGGALLGGRADTNERREIFYSTDLVFSPMLEIDIAVLNRSYGQWMFTAAPAVLLASPGDNPAVYVPLGFGLRTF